MKRFLISIPLLFFCATLFGQVTADDTAALRATFIPNPNEPIIYVKQTLGWERIKGLLKAGEYAGIIKPIKQNDLTLTRKDIKDLTKQINQYKDFVWPDSMFANSLSIPKDSMWIYASRATKANIEKHNQAVLHKDVQSPYYKNQSYTWVYGFSKPIYLNGDNICLIYNMAICGTDCGRDEVAFYKKQNGVWTKWVIIGMGDF